MKYKYLWADRKQMLMSLKHIYMPFLELVSIV